MKGMTADAHADAHADANAPAGAEWDALDAAVTVRPAAEVTPRAVQWLWPGNLALGKLVVLAGVPGAGKSLMVGGDFAARVTLGSAWPDASACPKGDVLIASREDEEDDTLVPRLIAHGADLSRVGFVEGPFHLGRLAPLVRELDRRPETRLVILDPVSAFIGGAENNNARLRQRMAALAELAGRCGACFLLISHLRKSPVSSAVHAVLGSVGLVAAARSAWLLTKDPADEDRRLLTPAKNNLGPDRLGYAWRLVEGRVTWEPGRVEMNADAALNDAGGLEERGRATREELAAAFISDYLKDGPRSWGAVERAGKQAGHKPGTLERARSRVAETFKQPGTKGKWLWRLVGDERTKPVPDADEMLSLDLDDILSPGILG